MKAIDEMVLANRLERQANKAIPTPTTKPTTPTPTSTTPPTTTPTWKRK